MLETRRLLFFVIFHMGHFNTPFSLGPLLLFDFTIHMGYFYNIFSLGLGLANSSWLLDEYSKEARGDSRDAKDDDGDGLLDGGDNRS